MYYVFECGRVIGKSRKVTPNGNCKIITRTNIPYTSNAHTKCIYDWDEFRI